MQDQTRDILRIRYWKCFRSTGTWEEAYNIYISNNKKLDTCPERNQTCSKQMSFILLYLVICPGLQWCYLLACLRPCSHSTGLSLSPRIITAATYCTYCCTLYKTVIFKMRWEVLKGNMPSYLSTLLNWSHKNYSTCSSHLSLLGVL